MFGWFFNFEREVFVERLFSIQMRNAFALGDLMVAIGIMAMLILLWSAIFLAMTVKNRSSKPKGNYNSYTYDERLSQSPLPKPEISDSEFPLDLNQSPEQKVANLQDFIAHLSNENGRMFLDLSSETKSDIERKLDQAIKNLQELKSSLQE